MPNLEIDKYEKRGLTAWTLSDETARLYEDIRNRAHDLYVERGYFGGSAADDWFHAERQVVRVPASALAEDDDRFVLEVELPGFEARQVRVMATDHEVAVSAENSRHANGRHGAVRFSEISDKGVFRRVVLPAEVDVKNVCATLGNGLLTVEIPKMGEGAQQP